MSKENATDINAKARPDELKHLFENFFMKKSDQIKGMNEISPYLAVQQAKNQESESSFAKAVLESNLLATRLATFGQSNIRSTSNLRSSLIDTNPNISDINRVRMSGDIQETALRQSNKLNLQIEAIKAQAEIASLPADKRDMLGSYTKDGKETQNFERLIKVLQDVQKSGDVSALAQILEDESFKPLIDTVRSSYVKLSEIEQSNKAQESELKLANSLNVIRAAEQQKQTYLNQSNFSVDNFASLRRSSEAANGEIFSPGPYKRGSRLQAIINEQDQYTNLGISNTDESLSYTQRVKKLRSDETMSKILSQKLGTNIGTSQNELTLAAAELRNNGKTQSDRVLGERFSNTILSIPFGSLLVFIFCCIPIVIENLLF